MVAVVAALLREEKNRRPAEAATESFHIGQAMGVIS